LKRGERIHWEPQEPKKRGRGGKSQRHEGKKTKQQRNKGERKNMGVKTCTGSNAERGKEGVRQKKGVSREAVGEKNPKKVKKDQESI